MKKTMLLALAGMTLLLFTQCSSLRVSKQYKDINNLLKECEKNVTKASDCEELKDATLYLALGILVLDDYSEKDQMTNKEEEKIMKYADEVQKKYNTKAMVFGCEDEDDE